MTRLTRFAAMAMAVGLLAAACSDDDTTTEATAAPTETEQGYLDSVAEISSDLDETLDSLFQVAFAEAETQSAESLMPGIAAAIDGAIVAQQQAEEQLRDLDPPENFASDHDRLLAFAGERRELWTRQTQAAAAFDFEAFDDIDIELRSIERDLLSNVSTLFGESTGGSGDALSTLAGLDDVDADYLDEVATAWQEFTRRNRQFGLALERSYGSDGELLLALLDAGAGEAFAAVRELVVEIDPPSAYEDDHNRLLVYLDETVRLDQAIAAAAADGDVVAFEVTNVELRFAGGRFALDVVPELGSVATGRRIDELALVDPPGGEYGRSLAEELRAFRVLGLDVPVASGVFPSLSDATVMAAIVEIEPLLIGVTRETHTAHTELAPTPEFEAGHARMSEYFADILDMRTQALDAAVDGDAEALRELGLLEYLRVGDISETQLWCEARADLIDDEIWVLVEDFFRPFGGGPTVDQLCPA